MATVAGFSITDYDGTTYNYYRFLDGYPDRNAGVFANFPQGDHDFCLETYVRRLNLEESKKIYIVDLSYTIDLRSRTVRLSSPYEDYNFNGTFEEAIRHFVDEDYSEKEALSLFPEESVIEPLLKECLYHVIWAIISTMKDAVPYLKFNHMAPEMLYIGDNINFYMYQDFIACPSHIMNTKEKVYVDACKNARRLGCRIGFINIISVRDFSLFYMLELCREGLILPYTGKFVRYGESIDEETRQEELKLLIEHIKIQDTKDLRALNCYYGIKISGVD